MTPTNDRPRPAEPSSQRSDVEAAVRRHPLFRAVSEIVRRLGWAALALYAVTFAVFIARHVPQIVAAEIRALRLMSAAFEAVPPSDAVGYARFQVNAALLELIPPPVMIAISIIAAIALVVNAVVWFPKIVAKWVLVTTCAWTASILSFFGCLWTAFWTLVETIVWVASIVAAILLVLANIAALVAAVG